MLISLSSYMVKHYWSFCYHQHIHLMSVVEVKTQTRFIVLFTSRSLLTWGKPLDDLPGISPRYLSAVYSQLTISLFYYRHYTMTEYAFFSQKVDQWRKEMALIWGDIKNLPLAMMVSNSLPFPSGTVLPEQPQGLGGKAEILPWHHIPVGTS